MTLILSELRTIWWLQCCVVPHFGIGLGFDASITIGYQIWSCLKLRAAMLSDRRYSSELEREKRNEL
ncbi:hypothetical protein E1A91_D11G116500v1 [Gossypium mustelinum]|uniref:Uncharacterized protein n=1 Tax=Gossypium mustelinum TaxID=34275 RepID=A0A5D2SR41_GOSMU|nr:hypothetical protein E1A91_D11G116500v1 [Gossypium mustelinum]